MMLPDTGPAHQAWATEREFVLWCNTVLSFAEQEVMLLVLMQLMSLMKMWQHRHLEMRSHRGFLVL